MSELRPFSPENNGEVLVNPEAVQLSFQAARDIYLDGLRGTPFFGVRTRHYGHTLEFTEEGRRAPEIQIRAHYKDDWQPSGFTVDRFIPTDDFAELIASYTVAADGSSSVNIILSEPGTSIGGEVLRKPLLPPIEYLKGSFEDSYQQMSIGELEELNSILSQLDVLRRLRPISKPSRLKGLLAKVIKI